MTRKMRVFCISKLPKVVGLVTIGGMCLIAASTSGFSELPSAFWAKACRAFPDGMGVMYSLNGALRVAKSPSCDPAQLKSWLHNAPVGAPVCIHLREATFGSRTTDNLHPHVLQREAGALAVMHNGSIEALCASKTSGPSDTQIFVQHWLHRRLLTNDDWLCPYLEQEIIELAGENNRFTLMDSSGRLKIIGEPLGFWRGETWLSNKKVLCWE